MLKLKLQYFGHLIQRVDTFEKTLMLGKIEGRRRKERQRMKSLDGNTESMDMSLSKLWALVIDREACRVAVHGIAKSWTWLSDWTELNWSKTQTVICNQALQLVILSSLCQLYLQLVPLRYMAAAVYEYHLVTLENPAKRGTLSWRLQQMVYCDLLALS